MALIIRKGQGMARLIRRHYVPKGKTGNTHAYSEDTTIGSIPLTATKLPAGFALLTEREIERVTNELLEPAARREVELRMAAEAHEVDPMWRLDEAKKYLSSAAQRSQQRPVEVAVLDEIKKTLESVSVTGNRVPSDIDPLEAVVLAIEAAIAAVVDGRYGTHKAGATMKDSVAAAGWAKIRQAMSDDPQDSLMAALQRQGWVKNRRQNDSGTDSANEAQT